MKLRYLLVLAILFVVIISPVSALLNYYPKSSNALYNNSGNYYEVDFYSESGFIPDTYEWAAIGIACFFTAVSVCAPRRVVAALIASIFWSFSTWYSIYMYAVYVNSTGLSANSTITVVEIVNAVGTLQIALLGCTVITALYTIDEIFFAPKREKSTVITPPE
jgi:hypothetical protein